MLPTGLEKYCCPPGDGLAAARMIEGIMQLLGDVGGERPRSPHSSGPEAWKAGGKAIPRTGLKERTIVAVAPVLTVALAIPFGMATPRARWQSQAS